MPGVSLQGVQVNGIGVEERNDFLDNWLRFGELPLTGENFSAWAVEPDHVRMAFGKTFHAT
jgi:hypothetical protein